METVDEYRDEEAVADVIQLETAGAVGVVPGKKKEHPLQKMFNILWC